MKKIREAIALAMGIDVKHLGCFTVTDHEGQPATLIVHGGKYKGVYVQTTARSMYHGKFCWVAK